MTPLEKVTDMAAAGTLYRGLNGMAFSDYLLRIGVKPDVLHDAVSVDKFHDICRGFVEFGACFWPKHPAIYEYVCIWTKPWQT